MAFRTDSLLCTAYTGPSASTVSCLSVTIVAISMMRSESGFRPVISKSIQIRFSEDFIVAACIGMVAGGTGTVLASFGRGVLVQAGDSVVRCGLRSRKLRVVCGDRVTWAYPPSADGP